MLVDTHTHVYDPDFAGNMLLVSTFLGGKNSLYDGDEDSAERVLAKAELHKNTYAILGIYPEFAHGLDIQEAINELKKIIRLNPQKVKAIGEIGLDYHCNPTDEDVTSQKELFNAQLKLATELELPVSLHIRDDCAKVSADAFSDAFQILGKHPKTRGVCHSFTGSKTNLTRALELGLYVSVNGIYTFNKDPILQETLNSIPLNRLLLETDAPFLTPTPHRKERNKSSFIPVIATAMAKSRKITPEDLAEVTTKNARELFDI